jgi:hypothetical protein
MPQSHLPPKVSDYFIKFLRKDLGTPESVRFESPEQIEAWKLAFPDPETSPAHLVRSLEVVPTEFVTDQDGKYGGWIRSFTKLEELKVWNGMFQETPRPNPFVPFHGISESSVKNLTVAFPTLLSSEALSFICSFPLLEDLTISTENTEVKDIDRAIFQHSTSPPLTGTLTLLGGLKHIAPLLSRLPGGLHFRKIVYKPSEVPVELEKVADLVKRCSATLECIEIYPRMTGKPHPDMGVPYLTWISACCRRYTENSTRSFQRKKTQGNHILGQRISYSMDGRCLQNDHT